MVQKYNDEMNSPLEDSATKMDLTEEKEKDEKQENEK